MAPDLSSGHAPRRPPKPLISVVVPVHNEEEVLPAFFAAIQPVLDGLGAAWEIVCVDDGSADGSLARLLMFAEAEPRVKIVELARNFGKEAAMTAGLSHSRGDAVVLIDADLQDPPELIGEMVERWREGYDMVYGARTSRVSDTILKRATANLFYGFYNRLSSVKIPAHAGDFRLLDRRVVAAVLELPERNRFMKGIFAWPGFRSSCIEYERRTRALGRTKFPYWRLWNFALDGLTSFSTLPLRVWTYLGGLVAIVSIGYASFLVMRTIAYGADVPGYASLMVVLLFLGGTQLISLGVIGEYLGRVYEETKHRPIYVVKGLYGFEEETV